MLKTLKAEIERNGVLLRDISMQRAQLNNKILGLYEKSLDLDLLDEQVKGSLSYTRVDELVVVLDVSS